MTPSLPANEELLPKCYRLSMERRLPKPGGKGGLRPGANPAGMDKLNPHQQLLVATAWVDDHLDPSEAIFLRLILQSCGVPDSDIDAALQKPTIPIEQVLQKLPGGAPREAVMRDVLRICFTDGILEAQEFDLIERVARQLQIDDETMNRLREQVSEE